jgi:hypothetical protein
VYWKISTGSRSDNLSEMPIFRSNGLLPEVTPSVGPGVPGHGDGHRVGRRRRIGLRAIEYRDRDGRLVVPEER